MPIVYLGLGSNLGDTQTNLSNAIYEIEKRIGRVTAQSAFHFSKAWGYSSEHTFCNAAIAVDTLRSMWDVLHLTQQIERDLGRLQKSDQSGYSDRIIDIDLLDYNQQIVEKRQLTLPHPLLHERMFVLVPLSEIAPNWYHPTQKKKIIQLIKQIDQNEK